MKSKEQQELPNLLKDLIQSACSICKAGIAAKRLKPKKELYFRRKVKGFRYDDNGAYLDGWKIEESFKPFWYYDTIRPVIEQAQNLSVFNDVARKIRATYGLNKNSSARFLHSLLQEVVDRTIEGKLSDESSFELYTQAVFKYLNGEEEPYSVVAEVHGIALEPDSIQLDENTLLRKITIQDIEIEYPASSPFHDNKGLNTDVPSAIIELKGSASHASLFSEAQSAVDSAIAILRLFKVGGVQYEEYSLIPESPLPSPIHVFDKASPQMVGIYLVRNIDVETLKSFWTNMKKVQIPIITPFSKQKEPDELSIAYDRHSDSLEGGVVEKCISSAVMGLEALYLYPSEQQEMSYRLRMRLGKLLSLLGYNPQEVRKNMVEAYEIRSKYVHGGTLSPKDRRKLGEKYVNLQELAETITDYLRASIVALLKRPKKTSLIQKIDDSFLDSKKEEEISELLFKPTA